MNVAEKIKEIDNHFINKILAGEFEFIGKSNHITTVKCGGVFLNMWMANGERCICTYYNGYDGNEKNVYLIQNMSKKRELYRVLKKLVDPAEEKAELRRKRAQLKRLKEELGEV
jgi:hypothetical protein